MGRPGFEGLDVGVCKVFDCSVERMADDYVQREGVHRWELDGGAGDTCSEHRRSRRGVLAMFSPCVWQV